MRCGAQKLKGRWERKDVTFVYHLASTFYPLFSGQCVLSQDKVSETSTSLLPHSWEAREAWSPHEKI